MSGPQNRIKRVQVETDADILPDGLNHFNKGLEDVLWPGAARQQGMDILSNAISFVFGHRAFTPMKVYSVP